MMQKFKISQSELWHRVYTIYANNKQEAEDIYNIMRIKGYELDEIVVSAPEYIEDIDDAYLVFEEND